MLTVNPDTAICDLAARVPAATRVFIELGIDFCCRGPRPLADACEERDIDTALVIDEINDALQKRVDGEPVDRSPEMLVAFIRDSFHRPLERTLGTIGKLLDKAIRVHGAAPDGTNERLRQDFGILSVLLREQQRQKEEILFPMILSMPGAGEPLSARQLERDQTKVVELLRKFRLNACKYAVSTADCTAVRALRSSLNELVRGRHSLGRIERYLLLSGALHP